jgi:hypothetical protein
MSLTKHFSLSEFISSETALKREIDNSPPADIQKQLQLTAAGLERVRACLGDRPIKINSGYRCHALNAAVGGAKNSQHVRGEAVDFVCPDFGSPLEICYALQPNIKMLGIDQLIMEGTWVHVSFTLSPRYEILTMLKGQYLKGLP